MINKKHIIDTFFWDYRKLVTCFVRGLYITILKIDCCERHRIYP